MAIVKKSQNGAELVFNESSFENAIKLKKEFVEQLKKFDYNIDTEDEDSASYAISQIVEFLLNADTSLEFEYALFECLKTCTYNNIAVTRQLFDDITEARYDYYEIVKGCVEVNLRPFMKSLNTQFPILQVFWQIYLSTLAQPNGIEQQQ